MTTSKSNANGKGKGKKGKRTFGDSKTFSQPGKSRTCRDSISSDDDYDDDEVEKDEDKNLKPKKKKTTTIGNYNNYAETWFLFHKNLLAI